MTKRSFLLGIILALFTVTLTQAKTYLVCVGISDYPGTKYDLRVSDNDAMTISNLFNATKDVSSYVLLNEEATQSALLSNMYAMFADAKKGDTVILYFSGHGTPGALACYDGKLEYKHIFKILKGCKASRKMIIADACFSGKMRKNKRQAESYKRYDVMLFLSSRTNERSQETQYKNSLFTIFLERGLRGGADSNNDRLITAGEIYNFVHKGVAQASSNKQHPVMWGNFDYNMPIIKW